jgi:hypothetical protein
MEVECGKSCVCVAPQHEAPRGIAVPLATRAAIIEGNFIGSKFGNFPLSSFSIKLLLIYSLIGNELTGNLP